MASLDRIRTEGFRRWYERQLIESHAWLVSWFLGVIVLVSGIEVAGTGSPLSGALLLIAGLCVTLYSWKRYRVLLQVAERLGGQAICPGCHAYAKFRVLSSRPVPLPDGDDPGVANRGGIWLRTQCRKCGNEWVLK